jgi:uncharacterized hydrophobic protein (TIGR00271 family)
VILLEVFGDSRAMENVARLLDETEGASKVRVLAATDPEHSIVVADLRPRIVDALLHDLRRRGVADDEITLARLDVVGTGAHARAEASFVWEDVLSMAWLNARPLARYLAFMFVAGVIACYGVLDNNAILIVGAMAVSPDLLPITAIGVGIVGRNRDLAGRAFLTLAIGLAAATIAATLVAFGQEQLSLLSSGFDIKATILGSLTEVNDETIVVAFAAGVGGMLALETRASSAVGVAISVTTIPAAAYLGVTVGLEEFERVGGALAVLGTNVAMLVIGASLALASQRWFVHRQLAR